MTRLLLRLWRDRRGVTVLEFAFIVPPMLVLIMGLGDMLFQSYVQAVLSGEVQKAGRDAGIEAADADTVDAQVVSRMKPLLKAMTKNCGTGAITAATWCSVRKSYDTFDKIKPEPFRDKDSDGIRDPGECFDDVNGNKTWDADPGSNGQGGASAVTQYTMTVRFPRIFPVAGLMGWSPAKTIRSTTILKNQPYATQTTSTIEEVCT